MDKNIQNVELNSISEEQKISKIFGERSEFKLITMTSDLNTTRGRELMCFIIKHCKGTMKMHKSGKRMEVKFIIKSDLRKQLDKILENNMFEYCELSVRRLINKGYKDPKENEIREALRYLSKIFNKMGEDAMIKYRALISEMGFAKFIDYKHNVDTVVKNIINPSCLLYLDNGELCGIVLNGYNDILHSIVNSITEPETKNVYQKIIDTVYC